MESPVPTRTHYLIGSDPSKWVTNVAHYQRVRYRGVYPGIDLVYYGKQQELEYDFVLAPGADPSRIRFALSGGQASLDKCRAMAHSVYESFSEAAGDKALVCLGSNKSNPVVETLVAATFGCESFVPQDSVTSGSKMAISSHGMCRPLIAGRLLLPWPPERDRIRAMDCP